MKMAYIELHENITTESTSFNQTFIPFEFYSQIINNLEDYAVLTFDKDLLINSWNIGATNIFKYTEDEVVGQHFKIIFTEHDISDDIPFKESETALSNGRAKDERWHIRKDKSLFYASGLVFPLKDGNGELIGFIKILRNITAIKESQEAIKKYTTELKELNIHKDKTLSVLSHDLRNPLTVILGVSHVLELEPAISDNPDVKEMVEMLHQSSKNMLGMLDNLLEWGRVKYAADIFSPEGVDLYAFVRDAFYLMQDRADAKDIALHNNIEEHVFVYADKNMLKSILQNLISNAIKYTGIRGMIAVSAQVEKDMLNISIRDNGIGMSPEMQEKLFIPQIETLSEPRIDNKGAGIGLLLVKEFLEKIGGEIWIESEENKGSTFRFTLPVFHQ